MPAADLDRIVANLQEQLNILNDLLRESGCAGLTVDVKSWENIGVNGYPYKGINLSVTRVERLL